VVLIKNWIRFVCFCVVSLLLFSWLNTATSNANQGWEDFYKTPNNSIDVVFLGNSLNFETFQPQIINDLIPINSYVLGSSGENAVVSYYELKEILKYQKPKAIVLETFALDLSDLLAPALMYEFIDSSNLNVNKLSLWFKYFPYNNIYSLFPILRLRVDWNHPEKFLNDLAGSANFFNKTTDPKKGYIANARVLLPDEYEAALETPTRESGYSLENNTRYLDKILKLSQENGIRLFFSVVPTIKIAGDQFAFYVPFDYATYAREHNIDILIMDFSGFKPVEYADTTHVNAFGSLITSIQIVIDRLYTYQA